MSATSKTWSSWPTLITILLGLAACTLPNRTEPEPAATASVQPGGDAATAEPGTYVVVAGDTIHGIAERLNVPVRALIERNQLQAPYALEPGQRLRLPEDREHLVERGETIYSIAQLYGVDQEALMAANDIGPSFLIRSGQTLRIPRAPIAVPGGQSAAEAVPTALFTASGNPIIAMPLPDAAPDKPGGQPQLASVFGSEPQAGAAGTQANPPEVTTLRLPPLPAPKRPAAAQTVRPVVVTVPAAPKETSAITAVPLPDAAPVTTTAPKPEELLSAAKPEPSTEVAQPAAVQPAVAAAGSPGEPGAATLEMLDSDAGSPSMATVPSGPQAPGSSPETGPELLTAETPASKPEPVAALAPASTEQPATGTPKRAIFMWPVNGKVVAGFGPKAGGLRNDGLNIAAPRGTPVRAAADGTVVYVGNELRGFGNLLLLRHADGWITAYAHNDAVLVNRGETVHRGQTIARVGSTGNVPEAQLHFEVRRGSEAVDPLEYLGEQGA